MKQVKSVLPTKYGKFDVYSFKTIGEHLALTYGDYTNNPLVRIHSEYLTGDVFGSERCDCQMQLQTSLKRISENSGIIIYLRQEGRGIGLFNKIKAYALQDQGADTVEANEQLGFDADARSYSIAAHILKKLKVRKIRLLTNNPDKVRQLNDNGIEVEQVPLIMKSVPASEHYLEAKKNKLGHML